MAISVAVPAPTEAFEVALAGPPPGEWAVVITEPIPFWDSAWAEALPEGVGLFIVAPPFPPVALAVAETGVESVD